MHLTSSRMSSGTTDSKRPGRSAANTGDHGAAARAAKDQAMLRERISQPPISPLPVLYGW